MAPDGAAMPDQITGERLTSLFRPRSVALVGASDKSAFSMLAYRNLVRFGFGDRTYLVSRRGTQTHGQPTVTSCAQIGEPVDVAYLMVPQAGLAAHAASIGMVLLGPNHLGFANLTDGVPVCSIPGLPAKGRPVALLSQSGASSSAMVDFAAMANVGLSYLVTLGNKAMITAGHVLDFLVDDPAGMQAASGPTAYINQVMQPVTDFTRASMEHGGVPYLIPGLRQAVVALRNVAWWSQVTGIPDAATLPTPGPTAGPTPGPQAPPLPVPAPGQRRGKWPENATRRLLSDAGIPVVPARLARSADEAVEAAADLGGPLVVKIVSADILHKSDVGGVRLGVPADEDAVRAAYQAVTEAAARTGTGARVDGVLISPMRRGGTELLVGVVRDPQWGPILAVALGGIFVEVLRDSALAPLPVTPAQAGRLLGRRRQRPDRGDRPDRRSRARPRR
jgi:acyl-CoA synthetase (NDP forming)